MEMTLRLPSSYVDIEREEMEYIDGGWNLSISGTKSVCGVPVGIYLTLSGTVADMANTTRFSTTKHQGI